MELRGYDAIAAAPRSAHSKGYVYVRLIGHPHAGGNGYVREHIAIAAAALGKPLPAGTSIHHVNEVTSDNRRQNLVICQDEGYHKLLHVRMRVRAAGGDPNAQRICSTCKELIAIADMGKRGEKRSVECKRCISARVIRIKAQRRAA